MIQYYCKQNKNEKSLTHGKWYAYPKAMSHTTDSVIIDRYTTTETKGDTVFVDQLTTEYRYRLSTDTLHLYHTDTIVKTTHKDVSAKSYNMRPWVIVGVVVMGVIIRKQIMKNSSRG